MISLTEKCACPEQKKTEHIAVDEDTGYHYHIKCGFGFLWMMKYRCLFCDTFFISGRLLRLWHYSHRGTTYYDKFKDNYDECICPGCREEDGLPEIAGSWSIGV